MNVGAKRDKKSQRTHIRIVYLSQLFYTILDQEIYWLQVSFHVLSTRIFSSNKLTSLACGAIR